jgi:hypothetical protein
LLHRAQRGEIDSRESIDTHATKAEEKTVDIWYMILGINPIHDSREKQWDLSISSYGLILACDDD